MLAAYVLTKKEYIQISLNKLSKNVKVEKELKKHFFKLVVKKIDPKYPQIITTPQAWHH